MSIAIGGLLAYVEACALPTRAADQPCSCFHNSRETGLGRLRWRAVLSNQGANMSMNHENGRGRDC